jgi:benzoylformate decarboxylase
MAPIAAAHALVSGLPPETIVVDEAITTGGHVRGFHTNGPFFFCRGGGLGWAMPAAVGASLAAGRGPVLCAVGDGSAMYSPQAMWTAAREQLPVVFAVANNRQYLILKNALRNRGGPAATSNRFIGMDLTDPPVDFVALAKSMGVAATLVEKAIDVGDAVAAAFASGRPHLLELPIAAP